MHRDHLSAAAIDDVAKVDAPELVGDDDIVVWATFVRAFCVTSLLHEARCLEGDRNETAYESFHEAQRLRHVAADLAKVASARWWREKGWLFRGDRPDVVKSFDAAKTNRQLHLVEGRYLLSRDLGPLRGPADGPRTL